MTHLKNNQTNKQTRPHTAHHSFFFLIPKINGIMLADRKHNEAVDLFRTSGEHVELRVLKKVR